MKKEIFEAARSSGLSVDLHAGIGSTFSRQLEKFAEAVAAPLLEKIAALTPPSPTSAYGAHLEYVYSAGCSSAISKLTAITCHLQFQEGYDADDDGPAEPAHMQLCAAYIGGVDILNTLLDDEKIAAIEREALEDYMRGEL